MKHSSVLFLIICSGFVSLNPVRKQVDPKDVFILDDDVDTDTKNVRKIRTRTHHSNKTASQPEKSVSTTSGVTYPYTGTVYYGMSKKEFEAFRAHYLRTGFFTGA